MKWKHIKIKGNLDIFVANYEEEIEEEVDKWQEVLIHGDPEGLKSLAKLLMKLAKLNQEDIKDLPDGAREHFHLYPNDHLSKSSNTVIVGRLDAKGSGEFYWRYEQKD